MYGFRVGSRGQKALKVQPLKRYPFLIARYTYRDRPVKALFYPYGHQINHPYPLHKRKYLPGSHEKSGQT